MDMSAFVLCIEIHGLTEYGAQKKREAIIKTFKKDAFADAITTEAFYAGVKTLAGDVKPFFRLYSSCDATNTAVVIVKLKKLGMPVQCVKISYHPE